MAQTYVVNFVSLLFVGSQMLGFDIPYTPEQLENFLTLFAIVATPLFTMIRQVVTGRATVLGGRGPAVE